MSVLYLYGFVPSAAALPSPGLLGIDHALVETIPMEGFAAVVGRVSEERFDGTGLEAHSGDVEWLAEQGLRHEQVVSWFVDHSTIVPSRLLTLFASRDSLRAAARADADRIAATLDRFSRFREWDLKIGWDRVALGRRLGEVSEAVARLDRQIETVSQGTRYLLQKKRDDLASTETRSAARRLSRELLDRIRDGVEEVLVLEPPAGDEPITLAVAMLVARASESDLRDRVSEESSRVHGLGLTVQLTGPWAPYRFMGQDDD